MTLDRTVSVSLQFSRDRENQDNEQHQSDSAEGIVAPSGTVTPTWKSSDEEKDKDDKKDIAHERRVGRPHDARQCFLIHNRKNFVRAFRDGPISRAAIVRPSGNCLQPHRRILSFCAVPNVSGWMRRDNLLSLFISWRTQF